MRTETITKMVPRSYKIYIAKDGKEFKDEDECRHHEMLLDGTRIVCQACQGKGSWKTDYVEPYEHWDGPMGGYWKYKTCDKCKGKGYLEKKITWE